MLTSLTEKKRLSSTGFEPVTFRSSVWRSPSWAIAAERRRIKKPSYINTVNPISFFRIQWVNVLWYWMPSFSGFRVLDDMLWQIKAIKPYPLHSKIKFQLAKNSCLVVRDIIKCWLRSNNSRWSRDASRRKLLTSHRKIVYCLIFGTKVNID